MHEVLDKLISTYGDKYLICDCNQPLITHGSLADEAKLYNLKENEVNSVVKQFVTLTDKEIDSTFLIDTFSGGQKVILLVLLALASRAVHILFYDLERSLDIERKAEIIALLDSFKPIKDILILDALS